MLQKACNGWLAWGIIFILLWLASVGVYIGRFARWNSWDAMLKPLVILTDVWKWVSLAGERQHLLSFSWLVFGITVIFYLMMYISLSEEKDL